MPTLPVTRRGRKHLSLEAPLNESVFTEGVFFRLDSDLQATFPVAHAPLKKNASNDDLLIEHSDASGNTEFSTPSSSPPTSWKSTETNSFCLHQPLLVSDPESKKPIGDEAEALGKVMQRSRKLPGTWYYSSNHVMVNQERTKRVIAPLTRLAELDTIAREQAEAMARANRLFHSNPVQLTEKFSRPSRRMGENVAVGDTIRDIHKKMMLNPSDRNNILHRSYTHMGMATARGTDGKLYLCQVFRG